MSSNRSTLKSVRRGAGFRFSVVLGTRGLPGPPATERIGVLLDETARLLLLLKGDET